MMLVSLIRMSGRVCQNAGRLLLGNCGERRAHERDASRREFPRQLPGNVRQPANAAAIGRWCDADAAGEEVAEAAEAFEPDVQTDVGDGAIARGQQLPRSIEPRADAELVRRLAEEGVEGPDEVK